MTPTEIIDAATVQQLRGLIIAWRSRPDWLRRPPGYGIQQVKRNTPIGLQVVSERRYSRYSRVQLPTVRPLFDKGAYASLSKRCRWCQRPVQETKRRVWHQHCLLAYWAATGNQSAITDALRQQYRRQHDDQDPPCELCGLTPHDAERNADEFRQSATAIRDQHRELTQPDAEKRAYSYREMNQRCHSLMTQAELATRFELDHRDALSVAWASGDERRLMRALALGNLRWLCHTCHTAKTGDDRRMMTSLLNGTYQHSKQPLDPAATTNTPPSQPNPEQASLWND